MNRISKQSPTNELLDLDSNEMLFFRPSNNCISPLSSQMRKRTEKGPELTNWNTQVLNNPSSPSSNLITNIFNDGNSSFPNRNQFIPKIDSFTQSTPKSGTVSLKKLRRLKSFNTSAKNQKKDHPNFNLKKKPLKTFQVKRFNIITGSSHSPKNKLFIKQKLENNKIDKNSLKLKKCKNYIRSRQKSSLTNNETLEKNSSIKILKQSISKDRFIHSERIMTETGKEKISKKENNSNFSKETDHKIKKLYLENSEKLKIAKEPQTFKDPLYLGMPRPKISKKDSQIETELVLEPYEARRLASYKTFFRGLSFSKNRRKRSYTVKNLKDEQKKTQKKNPIRLKNFLDKMEFSFKKRNFEIGEIANCFKNRNKVKGKNKDIFSQKENFKFLQRKDGRNIVRSGYKIRNR